jgi:hypothetical protein
MHRGSGSWGWGYIRQRADTCSTFPSPLAGWVGFAAYAALDPRGLAAGAPKVATIIPVALRTENKAVPSVRYLAAPFFPFSAYCVPLGKGNNVLNFSTASHTETDRGTNRHTDTDTQTQTQAQAPPHQECGWNGGPAQTRPPSNKTRLAQASGGG